MYLHTISFGYRATEIAKVTYIDDQHVLKKYMLLFCINLIDNIVIRYYILARNIDERYYEILQQILSRGGAIHGQKIIGTINRADVLHTALLPPL